MLREPVSLTSNLNLVTKIYFPREVFPLAALLTQVIDSSIGSVAVVILLPRVYLGWLTPRVYVGGEARFGWELHTRVAGTVGVQLGG